MSRIGPSKSTVLIMELSEALKNGNQKDVDFLKREIEQSNNEGVVRAMN